MNYIKRIELDAKKSESEVQSLRDGLIDLMSYLTSSKFKVDPTVQVKDVLTRIQQILFEGTDTRFATEEQGLAEK
jgi:hypothetical protein